MTLHFSGLDWEFVGFSNEEWKEAKPKLLEQGFQLPMGSLPLVQLDGRYLAQTRSACRYIAQRSGRLYPDVTDINAVYDVEYILEGAQDLFEMLIKYHYRRYNTRGGAKDNSTDEDRAQYGVSLGNSTREFFEMLSRRAKDNPNDGYVAGKGLTIADIFVCHYRWLLSTPEFRPLTELLFASVELAEFEAYYKRMLALHFGEYFASRYGAAGHPAAAEQRQLCEHEGVRFPFEW